MSDVEARVIRLEQLVARLLRLLSQIQDQNGQTEQALGTIRNLAGT